FSGPTSVGKTLAQQLGVSIWSSPQLTSGGLLKPARFTENSIELVARASNGLVLGLDELALIEGKILGTIVYGLASGSGKARMTAALKMQRSNTWSTFVSLSCEHPIDKKVTGEGGKWTGGMAVRFVDIDCGEVSGKVPPATIAEVKAIAQHYGV